MIAYEIGILPHINNFKQDVPDVPQPQYAVDAGALGTFARIDTYFNLLTYQGPGRGDYPKPPNSVLIVHPDNIEAGKEVK